MIAGIYCLLRKKHIDGLYITNKGIYHKQKYIKSIKYPVISFIPGCGIHIKKKDLPDIKAIITKHLPGKTSDIVKSYLKTKCWFIFSMSVYIFVNVFVLLQIAGSYNRYYLTVRRAQFIQDIIWYITNLFFLSQLYIYFKMAVKGVCIRYSLTEAGETEEYNLQFREQQPGVVVLIPAYREEPRLLRRVLLSLILQTYAHKKIVVLLDEDKESKNGQNTDNRLANIAMIDELQKDVRFMCKKVEEKANLFIVKPRDLDNIKKKCRLLKELYSLIQDWVSRNVQFIYKSSSYYPFDDYFQKEVIQERKEYFCKREAFFTQAAYGNEQFLCSQAFINKIEDAFAECVRFFNFPLELFMRGDYVNVSHERTKAANLDTYCHFINKKWTCHVDNEKGEQYISIQGESNEKYPYVAIIDADVIVKPAYLIRKIIFLEKKENASCGLIQSPYLVPVNENNRVAEAIGVHNDWFFPYSVGLNYYNSVFWLGYNGVFRYNVIKEKDFFVAKTVVEDIEISLKIREANYNLVTSPEEQCMTFSPTDMRSLEVQRKRWASGCLRIARIFIRSLVQRKYPTVSFKEIFFRFIYILNLNLLPVFSTLLYFTILSVSKDFTVFLILPWVVYILCLFNLERIKTSRRISQIIDSVLIYFYMNSFHLRGLFRSVRNFFKRESVFPTTPKTSGYRKTTGSSQEEQIQLKYFELLEIFFITVFYIVMSIENILKGHIHLQIFPIYYVIITYVGIARLVGMKHFLYCIFYRFIHVPVKYCRRLFIKNR